MKAIVIKKDKSLSWEEVEDPVVKEDEFLVKVEYAAVNRADLMQREGNYPPPAGCPEWPGLEISGTIVKAGKIASSRHDRYTQIHVRDNGIGIPLAAQRNIFDKFERVLPASGGKQEGKKVSGFGLGLNYVMNVAREHGGYVSVESVPGKFSEFTISLPLPPAPEEV